MLLSHTCNCTVYPQGAISVGVVVLSVQVSPGGGAVGEVEGVVVAGSLGGGTMVLGKVCRLKTPK